MNIIKKLLFRLRTYVASARFIWVIVGLFVLEAAWIALTGRYPMAFDEDFHMGVIKIYADQLSPFIASHPAGADAFGAVARDPSYLFQYLMSFPFRLIGVFTDSLSIQVLLLRFINIGLFASGLFLYRDLLLRFKASRFTVHIALLLFVLVPIVPLLAAQVNYDNAIFPLTALTLLLAVRFSDKLSAKRFDLRLLLTVLLVCVFSSLIKYAYLPIFIGIVDFLAVRLFQSRNIIKFSPKVIAASWISIRRAHKVLLVLSVLILGVLFSERYGINLVRYHTPVPDCGQVLRYENCKSYGPWIRDYNFANNKDQSAESSPLLYTQEWLHGMWFRSFFAVDGPTTGFQTRGPLLVPGIAAIVLASISGIALLLTARKLLRRYHAPALWLFASATVIYVIVLWITEYQLFLQTGVPVAINGRYLILLLPGIMLIAAIALKTLLAPIKYAAGTLAIIAVLSFAWGGGAATYVIRSNDAWYWIGTPMKSVNHAAQRILQPITPGGYTQNQFMR